MVYRSHGAGAATDAVAVADAADAVAAVAAVGAAGAGAGVAAAACPGVHAGCARRVRLTSLLKDDCYGRVRRRRPGHAMYPEVIAASLQRHAVAAATSPHQKRRHPGADWIEGDLDPTEPPALAGRRARQASCTRP